MKSSSGFSLIELAIVIALVAIIAAISFPVMGRAMNVYRIKSGAEGLSVKLNQARHEAVRKGRPLIVFIDEQNERIFVDINRNGIPEGTASSAVRNGEAVNEEYVLPNGVMLELTGGSTCFGVPTNPPYNVPAPPSELAIPDYDDWKTIIFDSRGELLFSYRMENSTCINNNMGASPSGALLMRCRDSQTNTRSYTLSISLRGGTTVLSY